MRVVVYRPNFNPKLSNVLGAFASGIPVEHEVVMKDSEDFIPGEGDIGVIFGWYKYFYQPTMAKKPIIEHYMSKGPRKLIVLESAFQKRGEYYQAGWDGFAGNADFNTNDNMPSDRWKELGIQHHYWFVNRNAPALVIGQLPRDTQVQDVDHIGWCQKMVVEAKERFGSVLFRPHPKCGDDSIYGIRRKYFAEGDLEECLEDCQCVITWNSTTGVDAAIRGRAVIAQDIGSISWPIASHSLKEPLITPQRQSWFNALGYSQWTLEEMRKGLTWKHLTK